MSAEILINKIYSEVESGRDSEDLSSLERQAILDCVDKLDRGELRVVQSKQTQTWLKQAILLYFRLMKVHPIHAGDLSFADKIPVKKWQAASGVRIVPPAIVRHGAHVEAGAILMPSFVNIGAFVGSGTMVDTWATVGSCAQIGQHVHLSGGVGIGGVLEPVQATPVVIEDNVFVGSRCILVEGVHIEANVVLGAGVTITGSSKIIDVTGPKEVIHVGRVPKDSVVVPGSYQKQFPSGNYGVTCALIVGKRNASTDKKTSLNQALRDFAIGV